MQGVAEVLEKLLRRYPELQSCRSSIEEAYHLLCESFKEKKSCCFVVMEAAVRTATTLQGSC